MQKAKNRKASACVGTTISTDMEQTTKANWTNREEVLTEFPLEDMYVKPMEPSVDAHVKLAKRRPNGTLPFAHPKAASLAEVIHAGQKVVTMHIEASMANTALPNARRLMESVWTDGTGPVDVDP